MIPEYAVEPEAIGENWQNFKYLIEKFGFDRGRLIARIPGRWERKVIGAAKNAGIGDVEIKRMIDRLERVRGAIVDSGRPYNSDLTWLDNVLSDHRCVPFQAIIAKKDDYCPSEVVSIDEVDDTQAYMAAFHDKRVIRDPGALVSAFKSYLKYGSRILFVDPFFDPFSPKYQSTFMEIFEYLKNRNSEFTCEIHYKYHKSKPDPQLLEREWRNKYSRIMPPEIKASIFCWKEKERGEDFHARYLLTEKGGISIDAGFSAEGISQTTNIQVISNKLLSDTLLNFRIDTEIYELMLPVIEVDGNGNVRRIKD